MSRTAGTAGSDIDGTTIAAAARAGEPDRHLAALLAPSPQREGLLALAAFAAEIARVPLLAVREPAMGDIRLQWWRDALDLPRGLRAGHAVADAIRAAAHSYALPAALLGGMIEGHADQLAGDPPADEAALHETLWKTEGAQFALAARILGLAEDAAVEAACRASGQAYGLTRLLWDLPRTVSLGRLPLAEAQVVAAGLTPQEVLAGTHGPKVAILIAACTAQIRDSLATARHFAATLPRTARIAFLPLALVEPYLRALERPGRAPLREGARLAPLARVCRIATAHLLGRP